MCLKLGSFSEIEIFAVYVSNASYGSMIRNSKCEQVHIKAHQNFAEISPVAKVLHTVDRMRNVADKYARLSGSREDRSKT
jgi:hypothetical protein